MTAGAPGDGNGEETSFTVTTEIEDGQTLVTVIGDRDVGVVVNSESGERVYLPPEDTESDDEASPYRPTGSGDSPYEGIQDESPYGSRAQSESALGVNLTANGFRVVHPEPADDVRFLR